MADLKKSLTENTDGNYFVDSTCINCGVSRHYAPDTFGDTGTYAYVKQQPRSLEEEHAVQMALLACPMASIGMRKKQDLTAAKNSFPKPMAENIYINGFNHRDSYGAHSYFIAADEGNWLIDSPRFSSHLVRKFEDMGGLSYIFLTHRDDVSDAHRFAKHFGAKRIIHRLDSDVQPEAELIIETEGAYRIDAGEIYFTPGHTMGHMVLLWDDKYLFSGDHFAWLQSEGRFGSFRDACWFSWEKQIESVQLMQSFHNVEWVFPGHGRWGKVENNTFPDIIKQSVKHMLACR